MRLVVVLALSLTACFDSSIPQGRACSESSACPSGQFCVDGVCRGEPGADVDAGVDTPPSPDTPDAPVSPSLLLASLDVSSATLVPALTDAVTTYDANTALGTATVTITATAAAPADVTILVAGVEVASGTASAPITVALGDNEVIVRVQTATDHRDYTVNVSRGAGIVPRDYVKASAVDGNDRFGRAIAVFGDTLVVGADLDDGPGNTITDAGAVYVFVRSGSSWIEQQVLRADNVGAGDHFGEAVAISGNTIAVGAAFEDGSSPGVEGPRNDSLSNAGAVYVFVRDVSNHWNQEAYVKASNPGNGDKFGDSVALEGDLLAVGAVFEDSNATLVNGDQTSNTAQESGAVYAFKRTGTTWAQEAYIKASNTGASDNFGAALALSGSTLAVGAPKEDSGGTGVTGSQADESVVDAGAVYVYVRDGAGAWALQAPHGYLKASNTGTADSFGFSVALDGDTLAVGAFNERSIDGTPGNDDAVEVGAVYVFDRNGTVWSDPTYLKAPFRIALDAFGQAVAISGDRLVASIKGDDSAATGVTTDHATTDAFDGGGAYLFVRTAGTWKEEAFIKATNTGKSDEFGTCVAISGDMIVVGAMLEDSASGTNPSDDSAVDSGAVYTYE